MSNKGSKSIFTKWLVYFFTMIQLLTNCILMGLITYFRFEAQINFLWSPNNSKVSEIFCLLLLYYM
jgi:hypothetical protein